jgi:hypothetical protein
MKKYDFIVRSKNLVPYSFLIDKLSLIKYNFSGRINE